MTFLHLSVKPLSSTWITSVFITICSLEIVQFVANLAMITALKCSGLSHAFRCVVEKKQKCVFTSLGRSVLGKTVPSVLSTTRGLRPRAVSKTSGTVFPNTDRPRLVNNIYIWYHALFYVRKNFPLQVPIVFAEGWFRPTKTTADHLLLPDEVKLCVTNIGNTHLIVM